MHGQITTPFLFGQTMIDLYKRHDQVKIIYAKQRDIAFTQLNKDTAYINLSKNMDYSNETQVAKMGKIVNQHIANDTTIVSIDLKKDTTYRNILKLMALTSKDELETNKAAQHNIILDGEYFSCTIITDTGAKTFGVSNPMPDSHPIIDKFLKETDKRLRSKNKHIRL